MANVELSSWLVLLGVHLGAPPGWAQVSDPRCPIVATIETRRSSITLADTARIRLSLTNTSDSGIVYAPLGPADLVRLVVSRNGERLQPNAGMRPTGGLQVPFAVMQPHKTFKLNGGEWMPLTDFGYRLETPGYYAIQGIPHVPPMADTTTIRSNFVAFEIIGPADSSLRPISRDDRPCRLRRPCRPIEPSTPPSPSTHCSS